MSLQILLLLAAYVCGWIYYITQAYRVTKGRKSAPHFVELLLIGFLFYSVLLPLNYENFNSFKKKSI